MAKNCIVVTALLAAALLAVPSNASADLLGTQVTVQWLYPNTATMLTSDTVAVVSGPEIVCPGNFNACTGFFPGDLASFDVSASAITFAADFPGGGFDPSAFNGFQFSGLSAGLGAVTGFTLATNISGLDTSRVSFDADSIRVNLAGLNTPGDQYFTLQLNPIPEPATLVMLGSGLVVLFGTLRRKIS